MATLLFITLLFSSPSTIEIEDEYLKEDLYTISKEILLTDKDKISIRQHHMPDDLAESGYDSFI